ncbi:hypothetical protein PM082_007453 [Marasmius tenuissimus]|nr:hypothetical protein PM082_007453 [Marasmius tenuissimus]
MGPYKSEGSAQKLCELLLSPPLDCALSNTDSTLFPHKITRIEYLMFNNEDPQRFDQGWNMPNGDHGPPNEMSFLYQDYASPPPTKGECQLKTSPTFGPVDAGGTCTPTNLVLVSSDLVLFHVNEATLINKSNNNFKDLLPLLSENSSRILSLADIPSTGLEIVLQETYDVKGNVLPSTMEIKTLI